MSDAPNTAFRRFHAPSLAADYARVGRAVAPFLPGSEAGLMADAAIGSTHLMPRIDVVSREPRNLDEGGPYAHWAAPTKTSLAVLPDLWGLYHAARLVTEVVTERPVILSPYADSRITLKVYRRGDQQGWHRDTNPVTALLVLRGGGPWFTTGALDFVEPGNLIVFAGRNLRHVVPPVVVPWKVCVAFNLYHPEDTWRPEGMDGLVYDGH